jgi:uncharacterized protein DUF3159
MSVAAPAELSKVRIITAVARRSGPHLIEATIVPAILFYLCLMFVGLGAAYVSAVGWSYAALARRVIRHAAVPPILVLGIVGITARTIVAVLSGSSFVYFLQPILATVAMAFVFAISVVVGRPLIGRLADEFWPISPEMAVHPAVRRLFRDLTWLWAGVNLLSATLTMTLLVSLPLGAFVAVRQLAGLGVTAAAVFVTVSLALATVRREGLVDIRAGSW